MEKLNIKDGEGTLLYSSYIQDIQEVGRIFVHPGNEEMIVDINNLGPPSLFPQFGDQFEGRIVLKRGQSIVFELQDNGDTK